MRMVFNRLFSCILTLGCGVAVAGHQAGPEHHGGGNHRADQAGGVP